MYTYRTPRRLDRTLAVGVAALASVVALFGIGPTTSASAKPVVKTRPSASKPATTTTQIRALTVSSTSEVPSTTLAALGRIVVGTPGELAGLDPVAASREITFDAVPNAIYEQLMDLPFGKAPRPALATSLTEAPDRLSWTVKVRSGVRFHDGTDLTAEAVKVNLERQRRSRVFGTSMALIRNIEVTGPLTMKLTLDSPYASMPYLLGGTAGIMISPKAIAEKGDRLNREPTNAGTGPYVLKEWVPGDHTTVSRNPNYWGNPKPRLEQITFRFIPDEGTRYAALQSGDVQSILAILPGTPGRARKDGFAVIVSPPTGSSAIPLNNAKPPFDDVRMRRAAALAIDSRTLATLVEDQNFDNQAFGLWPRNNPWYWAGGHDWTYDRAEARKLVASYVASTGREPAITFSVLNSGATVVDAARLLTRFWQEAGFDVKLQIVSDPNTFGLAVATGQYQAALGGVSLYQDPDATAYPVLRSTSPGNVSRYRSVEMDAALENGRNAADVEGRRAAYNEVQRLFRRDVPFLVGTAGSLSLISNETLCGLDVSGGFSARTVGLGNC